MNIELSPTTGKLGIYMDYQASTPVDRRVVEAMRPWLENGYGNPHANDHAYGWQADNAIEKAREEVAALINADPGEIVFTSGATEANNIAILGTARAAAPDQRRVLVSAIEHKCVLGAAQSLVAQGFQIDVIPVDRNGIIDLGALERMIDDRTALVSVMAVNNEVGTVQPIDEIGELCDSVGVLFHTDAAQALAVRPIDVGTTKIDLLSLSSHKAYGPKGIGALFVRRSVRHRIKPVYFGGGQEDGLRPGTLPTFLCVGLGVGCAILKLERATEVGRLRSLQQLFLSELLNAFPAAVLNGDAVRRHPGNLNFRLPGIEAELLLAAAHPRLAGASGSACTSGVPEPSHVLIAMGQTPSEARGAVRLSYGRFTEPEDIREAVSALEDAVSHIAPMD
ncbi:cysteine desulfurase family protein [Rhizobium leguminosarum]|uniref:cysteine desulfurase family protein n=1 Tax=Rhizobium leguminosarum TaxID=384 RepID=UPI00038180F7|nr:cysteine desulfurase family protein [Rhizobium leguminosarum]